MTNERMPASFDPGRVATGALGQRAHPDSIVHSRRLEPKLYRVGAPPWSLVGNRTAPHDRLLDEALGLANEYAAIRPLMLRETKALVYRNCVEQDMALVAKREGEAIDRCTGSAEQREALAAFREKRRPDFKAVRGG